MLRQAHEEMPSGPRVCRLHHPALRREGRWEGLVAFLHAIPALGQTADWLSTQGNWEGSSCPASSYASPRCSEESLRAPRTSLLPQKAPVGHRRDTMQPQTDRRVEKAGAVSHGASLGAKSEAHGLCCLPAQPMPPRLCQTGEEEQDMNLAKQGGTASRERG